MIEKPTGQMDIYSLVSAWPRYNEDDIAAAAASHRASAEASESDLDQHKSGVSEYQAASSGEMYDAHVRAFEGKHSEWSDSIACDRIVAQMLDNMSGEVVLIKNSIINEVSSMQTHIKNYFDQATLLDEQADIASDTEAASLRTQAEEKRNFAKRMIRETRDWVRLKLVDLEEGIAAWDAAADKQLSLYPDWDSESITAEDIAEYEDVTEKDASTVVEDNNNDGKEGYYE